ncbi:MAG: SMC family ATPase, partial [Armatimonadetes bacterium]|nr:SMC family ATPase [Armatimonadota bacterium]
ALKKLLRIEYETFINSAYLQQGKADAFTLQTPDKRKQILSDILGLDRYEMLEKLAKQHRDEVRNQAEIARHDLEKLEGLIANEESVREEHRVAVDILERAEQEYLTADAEWLKAKEKVAQMEEQKRTIEARKNHLKDISDQIGSTKKEREITEQRLAYIYRILDERSSIEQKYRQLAELRKELTALEPKLEDLGGAETERQRLRGAIQVEETKLKGELDRSSHHRMELQRDQQERARYASRLSAIPAELEKIKAELTNYSTDQLERDLGEEMERFGNLKSRADRTRTDLADLEDKIKLLSSDTADCPLCHSPLTPDRIRELRIEHEQKRNDLQLEDQRLRSEGKVSKAKQEELKAEISRLQEGWQKYSRAASGLETELKEKKERVEQLDGKLSGLLQIESRIQTLQDDIEQNRFAGRERAELQRIEAVIQQLTPLRERQKELRGGIEALADADARKSELDRAEKELPELERRVEDLKTGALELEQKRLQMEKELVQEEARLREAVEHRQRLVEAERRRSQRENERNSARRELDRIEAGLKVIEQSKAEREKRLADLTALNRKEWLYDALVIAFGRRGVPALIIDDLLPQIQDEANMLLARMTGNALAVQLTTQRPRQTGNQEMIETLDILISDGGTPRPYEMFSGGEAFRVNFALRVALSKLLARRAGTRLQTLIIDEGFGTQDGKGRERLIDTINAIKNDFDLILVITHIEELKDQFPARLEVTKTATGSQVALIA